jgi:transcriptional regulator with XRE-family HTH domain
MKSGFGSILSEWRAVRRLSQLDLALAAGISQRHISFVESGRAKPSRDMIFKLADGLDLPLRARNDLLLTAGFAPAYRERGLDLSEMKAAREALELILKHQEPYPAIVMDARWNIVMRNEAASRILAYCVGADTLRALFPDGVINFMEMMFAPNGLKQHIANWKYWRAALLRRLRREAAGNANSPSEALRRKFDSDPLPPCGDVSRHDDGSDPMLALELRVGDRDLRLFTTFTTFGTPQDVSLQELRIDMSFPADDATRRFLEAAATSGIETALKRRQLA